MSSQKPSEKGDILQNRKYKLLLTGAWAALLIFCFLNRENFTVGSVLSYTPKNACLAAVFMMFLFALKSLSVFIFSGILFAANGILFPLPAAILLNILGAGIMVTLPYCLGKRIGKDLTDRITEKYPKIKELHQMQSGHELMISFITRVVNILPSDILSLYMGAVGINYPKYLAGSILGMSLSLVTFPIMGMNITNPSSPWFLASICIQVAVSAVSIIGYWLYCRKKRNRMP